MKKVQLHRLKLENFKGVRNLEADFAPDAVTEIRGRNGSGKSTIFDAFTWCLFGKDSRGASQFTIKTQNEQGEPIHKLVHAVECVLTVDGERLEIRREYREKWVTKRGEAEETFQGHEESRYINGVPYTQRDFTAKIEELISYDIFQLITNPRTFLGLSTDERRARLVEMAGIETDLEIANRLGDKKLAAALRTKTIAELTAERKASAARIKQDLKGMPQRIEEAERAIPEESEDEQELAKQHYDLQLKRAELNAKLERSEAVDSEQAMKLLNMRGKEIELTRELKKAQTLADELATEGWRKEREEQQELRKQVRQMKNAIPRLQDEAERERTQIVEPTKKRLEELRAQFQQIASRTLNIELSGICPTCGAPYTSDKLSELRAQAQADFNARQARDKKEINAEGKVLKERLEGAQDRIAENNEAIREAQEELRRLQTNPLLTKDLGEAPKRTAVTAKEERLQKEIEEIRKEIEEKQTETTSDATKCLRAERDAVQEQLDRVLQRKGDAQRAAAQRRRVQELEELHKRLNQELASAERDLQEIDDFQKQRMAMVEEEVNSLFHTLAWRMYRDQVNGGQTEVCEPMINGVPYSDANNAARINAGVDICRAIGTHQGVQAPIFIDNAEAVNKILPTEAQQIHLVVTDGDLEILQP